MPLTRKPRVGDKVRWTEGRSAGHVFTVERVEETLAWIRIPDTYPMIQFRGQSLPFIWNFPSDGTLNQHAEFVESVRWGCSHCLLESDAATKDAAISALAAHVAVCPRKP